jgi:hypothetical protein
MYALVICVFPQISLSLDYYGLGLKDLQTFCHGLEGFGHCWQEDSLLADIQHHY